MTARPEVLLVSSENFHALAHLPRFLSAAGARVSVLAVPGSNLACTSFALERIAASESADATLDRLRDLLESGRRWDWIVFGDDMILQRAVERRAEPWLAPLLPARAGDATLALVSKNEFAKAARACGVLMASGRAATGAAQIRDAAAAAGYPVIVKPALGAAGVGIFAAKTPGELEPQLSAVQGDYIVEHFVEGQVGATAALFLDGKLMWWSSFVKRGVFPPPYGPSCRRLALEPHGVEDTLARLGAALGLHGLVGLDWIIKDDGALSVIELNGRPVAMILASPHVAQGLPAALRAHLAGRHERLAPPPYEGPVWHAMPASFSLAVQDRDWGLAARLLLGIDTQTDTPWEDPGLLRNHAVRMIKTLVLLSPLKSAARTLKALLRGR